MNDSSGAFLPHLIRHMAADVQREGRCDMARVVLNRLDVISRADGGCRAGRGSGRPDGVNVPRRSRRGSPGAAKTKKQGKIGAE
mgnify:CR=1 FL=1